MMVSDLNAEGDFMKAKELTPKQSTFVDEYLVDMNATQAAIRAGYSPRTANEQGAQLLAKLSIQEAIARHVKAREQRTQITADKVLTDLEAVKRDAMQPVNRDDGLSAMLDRGAALKALELQGKHLAMWTEKHNHNPDGQEGSAIPREVRVGVSMETLRARVAANCNKH